MLIGLRRSRVNVAVAATLAFAALVVSGCAALLPPVAPASARAGAGAASAGSAKSGRGATRASAGSGPRVPADSLPSREALAVLETIPEPLPPEERVAPAETAAAPESVSTPADSTRATSRPDSLAAPSDTSRGPTETAGDSARADFPVPSPTTPLGDRPGALERLLEPDSAASAPAVRPASPVVPGPAAPAASGPATAAAADTCFRIQIAARGERATAERLREAASSQLMAAMVIEKDRGLHKVRSRDCLNRAAADALRARALASGFSGAFRFVSAKP